jgi:hypothetical protein
MRQVEILAGISERSQIWMTGDGFALPLSDVDIPLIHALSSSSSLNFAASGTTAATNDLFYCTFYVYDRQLFLPGSLSLPELQPRIPKDVAVDLDQRIKVHQDSIIIAQDNLSQHLTSISENFGKLEAHSVKTIQNFQLLCKTFESDLLIVKSIPIHPSISAFYKTPTKQGPPFLSDYINEDSLRSTLESATRHIQSHEGRVQDIKSKLGHLQSSSKEFSTDVKQPLKYGSEEASTVYTRSRSLFIERLKRISEIQSSLASLGNDLNKLSSSLTALNQYYRPLLSTHRLPVAYGTALVELVRRREYHKVVLKRVRDVSDLFSEIAELENAKRKSFYSQVGIYLPEGLIAGLENPPAVCEINLADRSGIELPVVTKSDLKQFLRDITRIRSNLDAEKSVHSLHKLQAILTDLIPQLESVDVPIDKKIATSRVVERSLRHISQSNLNQSIQTGGALFSAPASGVPAVGASEKTTEVGTAPAAFEMGSEFMSIHSRRRRSSIASNAAPSSFPPNDAQLVVSLSLLPCL